MKRLGREELPIYVYLPYYFSMVHYAAFLGIVDDMKGIKYATWDHVREAKA